MRYLVSICLLVAAVIHLLPVVGVLGGDRLQSLYGVSIDGPDLQILMRHRAVLFGLLGGLLIAAAFRPDLRAAALVMGIGSTVSFLVIAWSAGGYNPQLARVVYADIAAVLLLVVAAAIEWGATRHFH